MRRRDYLPQSVLGNLGSLLDAIREAESIDADWAASASIHFLRNYTTEPVDPYLRFHLLSDDVDTSITHGGYDTMAQELLDPGSNLHSTAPDIIVMSLLVDFLDPRSREPGWTADDAMLQVEELINHAIDRTASALVVNTFLPPIEDLLGDGDSATMAEVTRLNGHLRSLVDAKPGRVFLSDFADHYANSGAVDAIDRRFWSASQAPFKKPFLLEYANDIAYVTRVLKGRAKKCLVLDCDNTIWGGVVGEDGLEGIELDDTNAPGLHFHAFQQAAIALHDKGVMLALCSKNNEEDVWEVLDRHPHCPLSKSHLVGWRVNWENKAANLAALADELNIGLDSIVFVDDSPQERALIESALPEVLTLAVPDHLQDYSDLLSRGRLFDTTSHSEEDRQRTQMYQQETKRKGEQRRFEDLADYLESLQTTMRVFSVNDDNRARVAQLTQKTNQFNLTTRRYSEADIDRFAQDDDSAVFAMSVEDRYGSMGLTGVLIAKRDGAKAILDTMLLSCRVLGRQLEFAFVDQCLRLLEKRWGTLSWEADYLRTRKNAQVADFWERVGFSVRSSEDSSKHYIADERPAPAEYGNIIKVELE